MRDAIKTATLVWLGCCLRNKDDRDATFKFINTLGEQIEKSITGYKAPDSFGENDENFR